MPVRKEVWNVHFAFQGLCITMSGVSVARRRYYLSISIPSEPILLPWVRTDVADFPYPLYLYITRDFVPWRPDAVMSTDNYISHSLLLFHYHGRIRQYVYVYVWGVSWQLCVQDMLLSWPKVTVEMEGSLRLWNESKRKLKSAHFSSTTFHSDWSQTMMSDTSSSRLRSVYRQIPEIERFFLGGVYHMWCHKLHPPTSKSPVSCSENPRQSNCKL